MPAFLSALPRTFPAPRSVPAWVTLPLAILAMGWLDPGAGSADEWHPLLKSESVAIYRWESTCNTYVIQQGNRALLIDLGDGSVLEQLARIGVEEVDWILLTSHHRERCQGMEEVNRDRTKIAGPRTERELLEDPSSFRKWYPTLGDKFSVYGASYVRPPRLPISLSQGLADGEVFRWRDIELQCLETPGNSPGGMTYLLELDGKRLALTGGLVHDGAKMVNWFDTEWDYGFAKGLDTLIGSVSRLIDTPSDLLLPAHGPPIDDPPMQLPSYRDKLSRFRDRYVRGYPVFGMTNHERDPISTPTKVPGLNRVTPHLYKLSDSQRGWNFAIIISDTGRGLILDCGLLPKEMLEELILGMREHLGLKSIDAFWVSHMHGDHFLLGPLLREKYGAASWTLDRIVDKMENPRRYDYAALVSAYGDGFDGMPVDKAFRDGETIEWEGYRIQVDWMPGQTEFGCSLWLEIDGKRIVFTGDNLFGNPADPTQDGHEAVVARNSCIFQEGYLRGSKYLLRLNPDIVMGSHSYVMPNPRLFLERYHQWAHEILRPLSRTSARFPLRISLRSLLGISLSVSRGPCRSAPGHGGHHGSQFPESAAAAPYHAEDTSRGHRRARCAGRNHRSRVARDL
jgi:glyoxylase-like metal-dependent hydrolase (beta-lactamase superfamily II)